MYGALNSEGIKECIDPCIHSCFKKDLKLQSHLFGTMLFGVRNRGDLKRLKMDNPKSQHVLFHYFGAMLVWLSINSILLDNAAFDGETFHVSCYFIVSKYAAI